jgi:thiol-disulfide isomerase/thioredoxin
MERLATRTVWLGLAALAALALAGASAQAGDAGKPKIVKIHADWCGTCTRLNTTFEALQQEIGSEADIVVLDVTDRDAVEASRAKAEELGLTAFFDSYKGKTGTVGVFDAEGNEVTVLKGEFDTEVYVAALKKAKEA